MPFEKGMTKVGGRRKGSKNGKTIPGFTRQELQERLYNEFGEWNPIVELAKIARSKSKKYDEALKLNALKELAKYVYPALKAVEHSGVDGDAIQAELEVIFTDKDE